jgi:hypothetical protein
MGDGLSSSAPSGRAELRVRTRSRRRAVQAAALVALLVGMFAGCNSGTSGAGATTDAQHQADLYAIDQIEVKWHQASSAKDVELMMSLWADNATFTTATQTFAGKDQIRNFFATQAAPFKKENHWVSDTPAYKTRITADGDKGTLYFECDYVDVATRAVRVVVSADQQVARINGKWLITAAVSATPELGG